MLRNQFVRFALEQDQLIGMHRNMKCFLLRQGLNRLFHKLIYAFFRRNFAQNFERLGLKKLISTSYAYESKKYKGPIQLTLFETEAPQFDPSKTQTHGKIFVLTHDTTGDGRVNIDDLEWKYLEGDGDFRSKEVTRLRDEADIIVTNPPFSLFREFLGWIVGADKDFLIIGNMNAITYKEIFPLIKNNRLWLGNGFQRGNAYFRIVGDANYANGVYDENTGLVKFRNCCWMTNLEHGRRHQPLQLMTMADNLKYSKHKEVKGREGYEKYDNYDAIEVPYTDAIPADYDGVMGVPVSFLDKYCPEQFEILGQMANTNVDEYNFGYPFVNGIRKYARILIRKKL